MSGPLAVKLTADITAYERAMSRARDVALRHSADIAQALTGVASRINGSFAAIGAFPNLAKGAAVAVAGFLAVKTAVEQVTAAAERAQERLEALVKIGAQASAAGVGTTFFQSWTQQAKGLNAEVSTLTAMLERAREAATTRIGEGGPASSAIRDRLRQNVQAGNLNGSALARYDAADGQEARIRVILALIEELQAKGAQLAALDLGGKMFGAEFETKLRTGVDMIGRMRQALDSLQVANGERIISAEEIQRAEALNKRLEDAKNLLASGLKPIQEDIARWEQQQLAGWVDIKEQIAAAVVQAGKLYVWVKGVADQLSALGNANVFKSLADALDRAGMIDRKAQADLERWLNGGLPATAGRCAQRRRRRRAVGGQRQKGHVQAARLAAQRRFPRPVDRRRERHRQLCEQPRKERRGDQGRDGRLRKIQR